MKTLSHKYKSINLLSYIFAASFLLGNVLSVYSQKIETDPNNIGTTTQTFIVTVTYLNNMDMTAGFPTLTYKLQADQSTVDLSAILTNPQPEWGGPKIFQTTYTVDHSQKVNYSNIFISVSGGKQDNGNPGPGISGGDFSIALDDIDGTLTLVPANVNDGSGQEFVITASYNYPMKASAPTISFNPSLPQAFTYKSSGWIDQNNYEVKYSVTKGNYSPTEHGVKFTNAQGIDDRNSKELTRNFMVDFSHPSCIIAPTPLNITPSTDQLTLNIAYNEEMDNTTAPSISFSAAFSPTLLAESGWSNAKTYTAKYSIPSSNLKVQSVITVQQAKDLAGNEQSVNNSTVINIDQRIPVLKNATMSPVIINRSTTTAQLSLTFDNADGMSASAPTIIFDPNVSPAILVAGSGNCNGLVYIQNYTIDNSNSLKFDGVDVTVKDAKDDKGNIIKETTKADVFSIDMLGVSCSSVTFQPETIEKGEKTMILTVVYEADMNKAINPTIVFVDATNNPIPDANTKLFNSPTFNWTSNTTCEITFPLRPNPQLQILDVHARITDAETVQGNKQSTYTSVSVFTADTRDIDAIVTPTPHDVTCADTYLQLNVAFNQVMIPKAENVNIAELADYDYLYDFLKFVRTEWLDNSNAIVTYKVLPDKESTGSVKVWVREVQNTSGRYIDNDKAYNNVFTAESHPPVINSVLYTPPTCHEESSGSISINASGGTPAFSYEWLSDDGSSAVSSSPEITGLSAGQYQVTVIGSDRCIATSEGVLSNPDEILLNVEVVQNVIRKDDGIIQMTAEGGTPDYTYFVNNTPYPDGRAEHLTVGHYDLKVTDSNNCSTTAEADITDQRVPTAFTPNGDGYNDIFMEGRPVKIFDRNGTLLFEGNDGWDGKYKGTTMRPAVYFYIVTFPDGTERKGTVQIFKK